MTTPIITFDIDGVIAGGGYIPECDPRPEVYEALPLLDEDAPKIINELTRQCSIYIVSSRKFKNALDVSRRWLNDKEIYLSWLCGVLCLPGIEAKMDAIRLLRPAVHVDDAPICLRELGDQGLLFLGGKRKYWWPDAEEASKRIPTVYSWQALPDAIDLKVGQLTSFKEIDHGKDNKGFYRRKVKIEGVVRDCAGWLAESWPLRTK